MASETPLASGVCKICADAQIIQWGLFAMQGELDLELSIRPGSASLSFAKSWWCRSVLRRVAEELRNFPFRIVATCKRPNLFGARLPRIPANLSPNTFRQSCSENMLKLREEYPWAGWLDLEMAGEAFAAGAAYGSGIADIERNKASKRP